MNMELKMENDFIASEMEREQMLCKIEELKQRAEAAEARIKASREQEPYGWFDTVCNQMFFARHERLPETEIALYAQPPIRPDVAELQRQLEEAKDMNKLLDEGISAEHAKTIADLRRQLEEAGWISIKEKPLPDCEGTYLIANDKGQVCPIIRGIIQNNVGSCFDWQYGEAITYWMPLPAAPTSYSEGAKSNIKWNHIDGPMFCGKDGYVHWLTLLERLMFRIGAMTIADLERKYNHNDQRG